MYYPSTFNHDAVQAKRCCKTIDHFPNTSVFTYKHSEPQLNTGNLRGDQEAIYDTRQKSCAELKTYVCKEY